MEKRVLIVYISTGLFNKRYETFKATYKKFCPGVDKAIAFVSDSITTYQELELPQFCHHIDHTMYPIINLQKFELIRLMMDRTREYEFTHVYYFNSNTKFLEKCPADLFLTDKIVTVHNVAWDYIGHEPEKYTYGPLNPKSACYIEGWYDYCQSCLFGGPIELMRKLIDDCNEWLAYDLAHYRIPPFYDEAAFNKWVHLNKDQVTILDNDWCMDFDHKDEWGHPDPKIVLTNSDDTAYQYKDRFFENYKSDGQES